MKDFHHSSSTNYNINRGDKRDGKNLILSGVRKCHHNVRKRFKSGDEPRVLSDAQIKGKQTNCPAGISFKLKKTPEHNHDRNCSLFPCEMSIEFIHNHSIESANAVKFHIVSNDTKKNFFELFEAGHSPSSAYHEYKNLLRAKYGEQYVTISADRAIMPDYKWVYRQYEEYIQTKFGKINSPEAFEKAVDKVKDYNEKHNENLCVIEQVSGETIVAVCDKLSKRVHKLLPQAGDIVYVDATSNLDRQDSKLIKFMTCSPAGGLPLGFVIVRSESEEILRDAFKKLKEVLPEDAFYNRGKKKGPVLFMTDDAAAEINALKENWPDSTFLLCTWHVLNAVWRWLWDAKHQIIKNDRKILLEKFRSLLYAKSEQEYLEKKEVLLTNETCEKYSAFIKHLESSYFDRKDTWAISVRNDKKLPTHSTNTSNYIETSFRITKDGQFNRTKAFNLVDLLDILLDDSSYYAKRLLDIGNGRFGAFVNSKSRYVPKNTNKIKEEQITDLGDSKFIVESENNPDVFYNVDMISGYCDCKAGINCGPCKHKDAVAKYHNIAEFSILPDCDQNMRALYHFIAEGTVCKNTWYRDLHTPDNVTDIDRFVETRLETSVNTNANRDNVENVSLNIIEEPAEDITNESSESESDGNEEILDAFVSAMDDFKTHIISTFQNGLRKGVKFFTKKLQKFSKQSQNSLEKSLFSIGKEINKAKSGGKKKKIGKLIPIQVTAKSRRLYKHRGRGSASQGRRHRDQEARVQMVITETEENVYHSLPKQKKSKNKQTHSLKDSVSSNRPAAKKH